MGARRPSLEVHCDRDVSAMLEQVFWIGALVAVCALTWRLVGRARDAGCESHGGEPARLVQITKARRKQR